MIKDYFILALRNLTKRKLRSWLTMLGIFISIATIFTLVSLSLGLQGAVREQFRLLGTDKLFVQPRGQFGPPGSEGAVMLTEKDIETIKKVPGVKDLTGVVIGNAKIESNRQTRYNMVIGLNLETSGIYLESGGLKILDGRALKTGDTKKINVGYDYAFGNLFNKPIKVGDIFLINEEAFKVSGIMSRIGNPSDDRNIYMPMTEARVLFKIPERIDQIMVQVAQGQDIKEVAQQIEKRLRKSRDVNEKTQDFSILTPEDLLSIFGTILNIVTAFLIGIAAISLFVGAVGITNTMYTSVLERTKEIGIMKAIGARNSDVMLIFLLESGLLGLVGGVAGVVLGASISKGIEFFARTVLSTTLLQAAIPIYLILGCLAFATIVGALSGLAPSWRASRLNPVDALRYE